LGPLIERECGRQPPRILDCSCGIGTQALGLARRGHQVTASDVSVAAVDRARREAAQRGLDIRFHVADMRRLDGLPAESFDAVLAADNSLPHLLSDDDLRLAAAGIHARLVPSGVLVATIRDYDQLVVERPIVHGPAFFSDTTGRRIVHQVWDWTSERFYTFHLYITREVTGGEWECRHCAAGYRALQRAELNEVLSGAGFRQVRWLMPAESGYYQPVVIAKK
jgi:SAM-dependent methyltransferase